MIESALPISTEIIAEHLTRVGYIVLPAPFQELSPRNYWHAATITTTADFMQRR